MRLLLSATTVCSDGLAALCHQTLLLMALRNNACAGFAWAPAVAIPIVVKSSVQAVFDQLTVFCATFEKSLSTPCEFVAVDTKKYVPGVRFSTTNDVRPGLSSAIAFG